MTALPPLLTGAVQDTTAEALPAVALTAVGAPGAVAGTTGVTAALGLEPALLPTALVAVTVNVYAVPLVRPVTVQLVAVVQVLVPPVGLEVTAYPVMALPPLLTGAVQDTTACPLPGAAVTSVGAPGVVLGVTAVLGLDAALVPAMFVAVTVKVYAVPLVRPVTVQVVPPWCRCSCHRSGWR